MTDADKTVASWLEKPEPEPEPWTLDTINLRLAGIAQTLGVLGEPCDCERCRKDSK